MNNKVKEVRLQKNMTQSELAEKAGVSRYKISLIENKKNLNINSRTMNAIAKALEQKVTDIFLF